jgi:hypothetical protein
MTIDIPADAVYLAKLDDAARLSALIILDGKQATRYGEGKFVVLDPETNKEEYVEFDPETQVCLWGDMNGPVTVCDKADKKHNFKFFVYIRWSDLLRKGAAVKVRN